MTLFLTSPRLALPQRTHRALLTRLNERCQRPDALSVVQGDGNIRDAGGNLPGLKRVLRCRRAGRRDGVAWRTLTRLGPYRTALPGGRPPPPRLTHKPPSGSVAVRRRGGMAANLDSALPSSNPRFIPRRTTWPSTLGTFGGRFTWLRHVQCEGFRGGWRGWGAPHKFWVWWLCPSPCTGCPNGHCAGVRWGSAWSKFRVHRPVDRGSLSGLSPWRSQMQLGSRRIAFGAQQPRLR